MLKSLFLLAYTLTTGFVYSWDLAYTIEDHIEFFSKQIVTRAHGEVFRELTALTYDAVNDMFIFVDRHHNDTSIFSYHIATKKYQQLVKQKPFVSHFIQGIAVDPVTSKVFWTDTTAYSILWISLKPGAKNDIYGNLLIKLDNKITPRGIAVDSCRGYIYWTNTNSDTPTIEKVRFDGTDRAVIVDTDMYMLVSITVDQKTNKIYWTDERGIFYSIESSDLDGRNRKRLVFGRYHMPNAITVTKDSIYWIDWGFKSIWKLPINASTNAEPEVVKAFVDKRPYGIVANYPIADQTADVPECVNLLKMSQSESTVNDFFNISNYSEEMCLHGVEAEGKLGCKCSPGYVGKRSEISDCHNSSQYFEGNLTTTGGTSQCNCTDEDYKNASLATQDSNGTFINIYPRSCKGSWDPIRDPLIVALSTVSAFLFVVCAVLLTKIPRHVNISPLIFS